MVFPNIKDDTINDLIINALCQKVKGIDSVDKKARQLFYNLQNTSSGIPQGNPLSPLLSNVYLTQFDLEMKKKNYGLVRYADDFVVLTRNKNEAKEAYQCAVDTLRRLDLNLHSINCEANNGKTKILSIEIQKPLSFLGISFDGDEYYPSIDNVDNFLDKLNTERIHCVDGDVLNILQGVKYSLHGWIATYSYTSIERYFCKIDTYINRKLFLKLSKLGWKLKNPGKTPSYNGKNTSRDCLSEKQRKHAGIPTCANIFQKVKSAQATKTATPTKR